MTLTSLSEPELIASAGGDPWAINQSLQSGRPFQISQLAKAFHAAGRHTAEAELVFQLARKRFDESWNHQNGDNPINDSAEVQRVSKALGDQSEQLPKIGADLEIVAAALADAQKQGAAEIAGLDHRLHVLDMFKHAAETDLAEVSMPPEHAAKLRKFADACHADAVDEVRDALKQMISIRSAYADTLHKAQGSLHSEGYDPPQDVGNTMDQPLQNSVRDLGPIAGTGAVPGIPGIGAADLGEVIEVPGQPGKYLAIFGDSFSGNKVAEGQHYRSVAVPVTFDPDGRPHFGAPANVPEGNPTGHELFPMPDEAIKAHIEDTLPAGTIVSGGKTYMMVTGTKGNLHPAASWLVEVNGDPANGWTMVPGSYRAADAAPTQVSGYKGSDGKVYIAADSFDRSRGVTMYRADPDRVGDRGSWQPWTGKDWGAPTDRPVQVTNDRYGELSFREIGGMPVLSGFNEDAHGGSVEVRVGTSPTEIFGSDVNPTVVVQNGDRNAPQFLPQPYGGYILPGSTLENLRMFVSQWNTANGPNNKPIGTPYDTREFQLNLGN
ncbi:MULTISPECIES: DUF4185 domain-containing protein [unclassified Mycobacterium]|uniref:putative alpha/beta hydrolase n=1 Tax=unclassified Mycobacterium TaxID=2642494 RepID=UPI0009ED39C6|nr:MULTISPECIES: DUF4185 domain-containing protein [unclassified Mycobacterium]